MSELSKTGLGMCIRPLDRILCSEMYHTPGLKMSKNWLKNAFLAQNHKIAENDEHAQNVRRVVEERPERFWKAYGPYS